MIARESVVLRAGRWAGGLGGAVTDPHNALPLAAQGYPTTRVDREARQRFEGGVEFQRNYDQPPAHTHCGLLLSIFVY